MYDLSSDHGLSSFGHVSIFTNILLYNLYFIKHLIVVGTASIACPRCEVLIHATFLIIHVIEDVLTISTNSTRHDTHQVPFHCLVK